SVFDQRMKSISLRYKLSSKLREWYMETSTHGEQFVYIVPYKKAIAKLLNQKKNTSMSNINYSYSISESGNITDITEVESGVLKDKDSGLVVEFDLSRTLASSIEDFDKSQKIVKE